MKDQWKIVKDCRNSENQEPCIVLRGQDICALPALKEYFKICVMKGCNDEFIKDLSLLISDFEQFQQEETTKIPD